MLYENNSGKRNLNLGNFKEKEGSRMKKSVVFRKERYNSTACFSSRKGIESPVNILLAFT